MSPAVVPTAASTLNAPFTQDSTGSRNVKVYVNKQDAIALAAAHFPGYRPILPHTHQSRSRVPPMVVPSQSRPQDSSASGITGLPTAHQFTQRQRQTITLPGIQELTKVRRSEASSSHYRFPSLDGFRPHPSASGVHLPPIVLPPSSPTSKGPTVGGLSPTSALFFNNATTASTASNPGAVAAGIPSSLRTMLDTAFRASAERFHSELINLRLLCARSLFNEVQEKEKWKAHCITFKRERDAEREKLRTLTMEYEEKVGRGVKRVREDETAAVEGISGSMQTRKSVEENMDHENALNDVEFALSYPSPSSHNTSPSASNSGSPPPAPAAVLPCHTRTNSIDSLELRQSSPDSPPALVPAYAVLPMDQPSHSQTTFVPFIPGLTRQPSPTGSHSSSRGSLKKRKPGSSPTLSSSSSSSSSASTSPSSHPSPRPRATKKPRPSLEKKETRRTGTQDLTAFDVILPDLNHHLSTPQPPTRVPPPGLTPSPPQGTYPLPLPGVDVPTTTPAGVRSSEEIRCCGSGERATKRRRMGAGDESCGSEASSSAASTPAFGSPVALPAAPMLRHSPSPPPHLAVFSGPEYELEEGELVESTTVSIHDSGVYMTALDRERDGVEDQARLTLKDQAMMMMVQDQDQDQDEQEQEQEQEEQEVEIHVVKLPTPPPSELAYASESSTTSPAHCDAYGSMANTGSNSYDRDRDSTMAWDGSYNGGTIPRTPPPMPSVIPPKFSSRSRAQHRGLGLGSTTNSTRSSSPVASPAASAAGAIISISPPTAVDIAQPESNTDIDVTHLDLMYAPMNGRLICRVCLSDCKKNQAFTPKSFPVNAAWETLRDHCVLEHETECRDVARLRPHEVYNLRRRLMMAMK